MGGFAVGDEVNVIPSFSLNDYSTYGEVILVPDHAVVRQPKALSFTEAASVWMMFVTAYGALIEDAKVTKGDFVLIPAASSSVGLAAIQIANYAGATTVALTRTSAKKQQLLDAGAMHVIATEEVDLVGEVMRITNGQGARVAFDPVGGPSFPKLVSALAFGGVIYIYGLLGTGVTPLPVLEMIAKVPTIKAHNIWLTSGERNPPQSRGRVRHQGSGGRRAQAGHRPYLHLRRDGGCAPLSRAERSVREDRGDCLRVCYGSCSSSAQYCRTNSSSNPPAICVFVRSVCSHRVGGLSEVALCRATSVGACTVSRRTPPIHRSRAVRW